jgi:hypothetical protein
VQQCTIPIPYSKITVSLWRPVYWKASDNDARLSLLIPCSVKVYMFRIASSAAFFQAIYSVDPCSGGMKFFTLLISDLLVGRFLEFVTPVVISKVVKVFGTPNSLSDEDNRPEFDISCEFVELLHRYSSFIYFYNVFHFLSIIHLKMFILA